MMRTNAGFHADQAGRHIRQPRFDLTTRPLLTLHNSAAIIQPDDVERVLTDIDADHNNCAVEVLGHDVLLCLWSPLPDSSLAGQEHGRTIPLADSAVLA